MHSEPFTVVARVAKTHGLNGEVSVVPATEAPLSLLEGCACWFTPPPRDVRSSRIARVRSGPRRSLVLFDGIDHIDRAQALVGTQVLVRTDELPAAWTDLEDEWDCTGYAVSDETHGLLGSVVETIETGANDVWVVHGSFGEILIPVIEQVVADIDDDAETIRVRLLPGLMPGEGEDA